MPKYSFFNFIACFKVDIFYIFCSKMQNGPIIIYQKKTLKHLHLNSIFQMQYMMLWLYG